MLRTMAAVAALVAVSGAAEAGSDFYGEQLERMHERETEWRQRDVEERLDRIEREQRAQDAWEAGQWSKHLYDGRDR